MLYNTYHLHCGHICESAEQAQARSRAEALAASKGLWGRIKQSLKSSKDRAKLIFVESWCSEECKSNRYNHIHGFAQRSPRRSATVAGPSGTQNVAQEQGRGLDDAGHRRAPEPRATAATLSLIENPEDLAAVASLVAAQLEARAGREDRGNWSSRHVNALENAVEPFTELQQFRRELVHESDNAFRVLHRKLRHPSFVTYGPASCRDCNAVKQACLADFAEKVGVAHSNGRHVFAARVTYDIELEAFLAADRWADLAFARPETPPRGETPSLPEEQRALEDEDIFVIGDEFEEVRDAERFVHLSDDEDVSPLTTPNPNPHLGRDLLRRRPDMFFNHETCESESDWGLPQPVVRYDEDVLEQLNKFRFPPVESSNGESSSKRKGKEREVLISPRHVPYREEALTSTFSQPLQEQDGSHGAGQTEVVDAGTSGAIPDSPTLNEEVGRLPLQRQSKAGASDAGNLTELPDLPPAGSLKVDESEVSTQRESGDASPTASLVALKFQWSAMIDKYNKWDEKTLGMLVEAIERCAGEPGAAKWEPWTEVSRQIENLILVCDAAEARALAMVNVVAEAETLGDIIHDESAPMFTEEFTDDLVGSSSTSDEDKNPQEDTEQDQNPDNHTYGLEYDFTRTLAEDSTDVLVGKACNSEENEMSGQTGTSAKNEDAAIGLTYDNDASTKELGEESGSDYESTAIIEEDSDGESEGAGFDGFDSPAEFFGLLVHNEHPEDEDRSSEIPHVRDESMEYEITVYLSPESITLPPSPSPPPSPIESRASPPRPLPRINPHTPAGQAAAQLVRSYYGVPPQVPLCETSCFTGRPTFAIFHDIPKLKWKNPHYGKMHGRLVSQGPRGEYGLNITDESWNYRCEIFDLGSSISWAAEPSASVFEDSDVSEGGNVSGSDESENNAESKQEADDEDQQLVDNDDAVSTSSTPSSSSSSSSGSPVPIDHRPLFSNFHDELRAADELFSEQDDSVGSAFEAAFDELFDPNQPENLSPALSDVEPVYDGLLIQEALPTNAEEELEYKPKQRSSLRKELLDDGSF